VALLLAGGVAPAQEGEGKEKGKPSDEERAARRELLKQRLYGHDRADRVRAAGEAIDSCELDEEFWLEFMDTPFPTDDEQEQAKELAARALVNVGTERSLPRLLRLMEEEPKCVSEGVDEHGKKVLVMHYQFHSNAALACHGITMRANWARVEAAIAGNKPDEQGDILLGMFIEGQSAYERVRSEGAPEEMPGYWRGRLAMAARDLGPAGARALARAITRTEDVQVRKPLCLAARFPSSYEYLRQHPDLRKRLESEGYSVDEMHREAARLAARVHPEYEAMREGVKEIIVAVLRWNVESEAEMMPLRLVPIYDLVELEEEIIAFIRRRGPHTNPFLQGPRASQYKASEYYGATSEAYNALLEIGSDTAIDFALNHTGSRAWATRDPHPERTLPKLIAAIARGREAPWEDRFDSLTGHLSKYDRVVDHEMLQILEETLDRVRELHARLPDEDPRKHSVAWTIRRIKRHIRCINAAKAEAEGELEGGAR
jgi:hypothetical protein